MRGRRRLVRLRKASRLEGLVQLQDAEMAFGPVEKGHGASESTWWAMDGR